MVQVEPQIHVTRSLCPVLPYTSPWKIFSMLNPFIPGIILLQWSQSRLLRLPVMPPIIPPIVTPLLMAPSCPVMPKCPPWRPTIPPPPPPPHPTTATTTIHTTPHHHHPHHTPPTPHPTPPVPPRVLPQGHSTPSQHRDVFYLSQTCLRTVLDSNNLLSFIAETIWFSVAVLATRS